MSLTAVSEPDCHPRLVLEFKLQFVQVYAKSVNSNCISELADSIIRRILST